MFNILGDCHGVSEEYGMQARGFAKHKFEFIHSISIGCYVCDCLQLRSTFYWNCQSMPMAILNKLWQLQFFKRCYTLVLVSVTFLQMVVQILSHSGACCYRAKFDNISASAASTNEHKWLVCIVVVTTRRVEYLLPIITLYGWLYVNVLSNTAVTFSVKICEAQCFVNRFFSDDRNCGLSGATSIHFAAKQLFRLWASPITLLTLSSMKMSMFV